MNIELRNNGTLVISQAILACQSTELLIHIGFKESNFSIEPLTDEQKKILVSRIFIHNNSPSLFEIENQLNLISVEYPQWDTAKHKLVSWLSEYHGSLRKACLTTVCKSSTSELLLFCWHVEKINNQFEQLYIKYPQITTLHKKLNVVTYQELLKLYERFIESNEDKKARLIYTQVTKLIKKRNQIAIWKHPRSFSDEMMDKEVTEFASNWTAYKSQVLLCNRYNPWMKYGGIALSSMFVMSLVTILTYHLHFRTSGLSVGLILAICVTYGIRDVIKDILKERLYKIFTKVNPEQRFKIHDSQSRSKIGERTSLIKLRQHREFKLKEKVVNKNAKSKRSILYTETHVHLEALNTLKKLQHFRILDDQGNSYRTTLEQRSQLEINVSVMSSNKTMLKKTYQCQLGSVTTLEETT